MQRNIITTKDGSKTIQIVEWNEHYHSVHGAIQEANHVFIKHGLLFFLSKIKESSSIHILEIGFGSGLNAFLTYLQSHKLKQHFNYTGVEAFPVVKAEVMALNYAQQLQTDNKPFIDMHESLWEIPQELSPFFTLTKQQKDFFKITDFDAYHLIYFDAFGARVQPELWTEALFKKMYDALKPHGVLVTYSAKGSVRRALIDVGFTVEKLPGPPGKREMLRAIKSE